MTGRRIAEQYFASTVCTFREKAGSIITVDLAMKTLLVEMQYFCRLTKIAPGNLLFIIFIIIYMNRMPTVLFDQMNDGFIQYIET